MAVERGRNQFRKYKCLLHIMVNILAVFPYRFRKSLFYMSSNFRGKKGIALRYIFLKSFNRNIGDNVAIYEGVHVRNPEGLVIGNNVSINPMCYIEAAGGIEIGNDVSIAHMTTLISSSHKYNDPMIPIKNQGVDLKRIKIENNVWIGAKVTVLYGVTIGSGTIIGANALVNRDIPQNIIAGGIPAKKLKDRI